MKTLIPSVDTWPRGQFTIARLAQMEAQKSADQKSGSQNVIYSNIEFDEILCDTCNAEIHTVTIILVEFGSRVNCQDCYLKWYAKQPIKWRRMNEDGTLGGYVSNQAPMDFEP